MIYEFKCQGECGKVHTYTVPLSAYTGLKTYTCCGIKMQQLYEIAKPIVRTTFPRNFVSEHVAKNPTKIRDEKHFRDVAESSGLTVTNPWDGI